MKTDYHIPMEQMLRIEGDIAKKTHVEEMLALFTYDKGQNLQQNLNNLAAILTQRLQLSEKVETTLREFLIDKNIPIEVSLPTLKPGQLVGLLQEWISCYSENSSIVEKQPVNNHRNIVFRRALIEERATVDDYFSTLSSKNMLKAVDLYQLLQDILSNYQLYEFIGDHDCFFDKTNSFEAFLQVV